MKKPFSRKLMLQLLGVTAGLTLSAWGHAVGMGGINVVSALGQPLKAEIELVAVSKADKPGLVARLASPDAYKGAGLEYPYNIKYSFEIGSRANGEPYLKLSSNSDINDPFVSLLVELSWASGKLMREYTFLLDPPGYVAVQPKPVAVAIVAPEVVMSAPLSVIEDKHEAVTEKHEVAAEKPVDAAVKSAAKPAEPVFKPVERKTEKRVEPVKVEPVKHDTASSVAVMHGDTLGKIAAQNKPDDISLERMLVALYRANADQFDGKNMNRIQSGKVLRMPDRDEIMNVTQSEAIGEVHAQATDWNAYRQKLASAATTSRRSDETRQVATGKISAPAADKTPVASESAKEVLRLSKGEAPGDKAGAAGRSAQDKRNAAAEDEIAKVKALDEAKTRAALLEKNRQDMEHLAQLKSEAAALIAASSKVSVESVAASAAVSSVASASDVAAAGASQVAAASAVSPAEEMSLVDTLLGSPLMLGLGAAALLALGGLGIALGRRKKPVKIMPPAQADVGLATGQLTVPVVPSPDTGDFTMVATPAEAPHPDDVDPISEAELFMNFGRDEQAEEVLKEAIIRSPDNHQLHLKLLGLYAKRQDTDAFANVARMLEATGDEDTRQQVEALIQKMHSSAASIEDAGSATQLTAAFVDESATPAEESHDIVIPVAEADEVNEDIAAEMIDFDVTSTLPSQAETVDFDVTSSMLHTPDVLDFDIEAKAPEAAEQDEQEEALPNLDDLIFDVMSGHETADEPTGGSPEGVEDDNGMEFTLDFPLDDIDEKSPHNAASINLADISLDMDDVSTPAATVAEGEKSEHWHEVATKLDLARAYQEMGDDVGSKEILDEVMSEGDEMQRQEAEALIKQLA